MTTQLNFEISKPGEYLGENTQYNGDGFRQDKFTLQAVSAGRSSRNGRHGRRATLPRWTIQPIRLFPASRCSQAR